MKYVTINEKAAAMALDFVVGAEVRVGIERLYELLDGAMQSAYDEGFEEGEGADVEDTFNAGYDAGYEQSAKDTSDADEAFYDASTKDETDEGVFSTDECQCETCTVERAEASEQDDTLTTPVPLPPMQEQRKTAPYAWS